MAGLRIRTKATSEPPSEKEIQHIIERLQLSKKRADFCKEFIIDYKPQEACIRAGITKKYGYLLLKDKKIIEAIQAMQGTLEAYDEITPVRLVGQMAIWSKSSIGDYYNADWSVKRLDELTPEQISCIQSVEMKHTQFGTNIKLTLVDKKQANENLARPLASYEKPDNDAEEIDNMTAEQLETFINETYHE